MIDTVNRISIRAPVHLVFELGQDVGRWPSLLAHYRYVEVEGEDVAECRRVVRMGARRGVIPVRWTAEQIVLSEEGRVQYRHVAGLTRGMDVEWRIVPTNDGCVASITHVLTRPRGLLRLPFASWIAGRIFISGIADETLRGIKLRAESDAGRAAATGTYS